MGVAVQNGTNLAGRVGTIRTGSQPIKSPRVQGSQSGLHLIKYYSFHTNCTTDAIYDSFPLCIIKIYQDFDTFTEAIPIFHITYSSKMSPQTGNLKHLLWGEVRTWGFKKRVHFALVLLLSNHLGLLLLSNPSCPLTDADAIQTLLAFRRHLARVVFSIGSITQLKQLFKGVCFGTSHTPLTVAGCLYFHIKH